MFKENHPPTRSTSEGKEEVIQTGAAESILEGIRSRWISIPIDRERYQKLVVNAKSANGSPLRREVVYETPTTVQLASLQHGLRKEVPSHVGREDGETKDRFTEGLHPAATMIGAVIVCETVDSGVTGNQAIPIGLTSSDPVTGFYPEVRQKNVVSRTYASKSTNYRGTKAGVDLLRKAVHGARKGADLRVARIMSEMEPLDRALAILRDTSTPFVYQLVKEMSPEQECLQREKANRHVAFTEWIREYPAVKKIHQDTNSADGIPVEPARTIRRPRTSEQTRCEETSKRMGYGTFVWPYDGLTLWERKLVWRPWYRQAPAVGPGSWAWN